MTSLFFIFLAVFALILIGYAIGAFFILYHLIRFGVGTAPKQIALVFTVGSLVLLFMTGVAFVLAYPAIADYAAEAELNYERFQKTNKQ